MNQWRDEFLGKLNKAQAHWNKQFEDALDSSFVPVFDDFKGFLADNGFKLSVPLSEPGRRSFKFELAENAYMLMIFRSSGVGEFELRTESFVPGSEPVLNKAVGRVADFTKDWVTERVQTALDTFVDLLSGAQRPQPAIEELVGV